MIPRAHPVHARLICCKGAAVWFLRVCRHGKELTLVRNDMTRSSRDQISILVCSPYFWSSIPSLSVHHDHYPMPVDCCVYLVVDGIVGCTAIVIKGGGKSHQSRSYSSFLPWRDDAMMRETRWGRETRCWLVKWWTSPINTPARHWNKDVHRLI